MTTFPSHTERDEQTEADVLALRAIKDRTSEAVAEVRGDLRADAVVLASAVHTVASRALQGREQAAAHLANLDLHPDGRKARAEAEVAQAEADLSEAAERLAATRDVLAAQLEVRALPQEPRADRASLIRQDALTILGMHKKKGDALQALASDSDPAIRALVAGPWGRRYAQAAGVDDVTMSLVRDKALEVTAAGHDELAAAARAARAMRTMPVELAVNNARRMLLQGR